MNQRRVNRVTVVGLVLIFLTLGRLATQTNIVYDILEPVLKPLESISTRLQPVSIDRTDLPAPERAEVGIKIIRKNVQSFSKTVWIDAGRTAGLQEGDTVTVNGFLYGVVIEVFDETAVVQTIIDPNFRATAIVGDARGIVTIEYGSLLFDLVPRVGDSLIGKTLVTDGLDGTFEVDVPIGKIGQETASESDVFSSYSIELPYNPYDVSDVEVLTNSTEVEE